MNDFVITRTREMACDNKCEPIKSVIETLSNLFTSDDINESGFFVSEDIFPTETYGRELSQDPNAIHNLVSMVLKMHNLQECENLLNLLTRYDYQKGHIYEDEVRRLQAKIDEMHKAIYAPRMVVKKQHNHNCQQFMGKMKNPKFITQSKDEAI